MLKTFRVALEESSDDCFDFIELRASDQLEAECIIEKYLGDIIDRNRVKFLFEIDKTNGSIYMRKAYDY